MGTAPADTTNAPPTPSESLRLAVTALDAVGMIDAILDNFPESELDSDATHYSQTLRTVLAARAPALTLPRIERLLWYGLFDWAIRDSDAMWAYFLVRTLPLADQDAWRVRDDGTWFGRFEANLPDAFCVSSAYSGVGSEFTGGLPSGRPTDPDIVDMLLTRIWGHWGANHDATSAIWVTRTLVGLGPAEMTWPAPDPPSVEVRAQAAPPLGRRRRSRRSLQLVPGRLHLQPARTR